VLLKTIGMVEVAAFAASAEGSPPTATSTATRRLTSSAAIAGKRLYAPRAQRNSVPTFSPSIRPPSLKPLQLELHQFGVRELAEFEAAFAEVATKADVAVSEASRRRQGTAQSRSGGPR
jgi:hypothetical protein